MRRKSLSKGELGNKAYMNYRKEQKEKPFVPKPPRDEIGLYYSMKYDFDNGRLTDKHKLELFKKLELKYKK